MAVADFAAEVDDFVPDSSLDRHGDPDAALFTTAHEEFSGFAFVDFFGI